MPDLLSHVAGGYLVGWVGRRNGLSLVLVLLGAILPDLIHKPLGLVFPSWHYYIMASHSVTVQVLLCVLLALQIEKPVFLDSFVSLVTGTLSHLFLDALQYNTRGFQYPLFAPFSYVEPGLKIVPSESWLGFLIPLGMGATALAVMAFRRRKSPVIAKRSGMDVL